MTELNAIQEGSIIAFRKETDWPTDGNKYTVGPKKSWIHGGSRDIETESGWIHYLTENQWKEYGGYVLYGKPPNPQLDINIGAIVSFKYAPKKYMRKWTLKDFALLDSTGYRCSILLADGSYEIRLMGECWRKWGGYVICNDPSAGKAVNGGPKNMSKTTETEIKNGLLSVVKSLLEVIGAMEIHSSYTRTILLRETEKLMDLEKELEEK